jgi:hypothetical protein
LSKVFAVFRVACFRSANASCCRSFQPKKQHHRNALFGEGKNRRRHEFSWVNDNIPDLSKFCEHVDNNKDAYSREDWDEVKLMYEALDSRKIRLKRRSSGDDNRKNCWFKVEVRTNVYIEQNGIKWRNAKS